MTRFGEDVRAILERDPAARTRVEVVLAYPGLHALWGYRLARFLWRHHMRTFGRWISHVTRFFTGVEIHPGAQLGKRVFIDHGMGVVIGETTEVGDGCSIYQGATLGGTSLEKGKRHPTLEEGVVVGAGAKVLGPVTIGANARIGANSVVIHDVPPDTVVVGVPGQILNRKSKSSPPVEGSETDVPDAVGEAVASLIGRVETLERRSVGQVTKGPHAPRGGVWDCEDFTQEDFSI